MKENINRETPQERLVQFIKTVYKGQMAFADDIRRYYPQLPSTRQAISYLINNKKTLDIKWLRALNEIGFDNDYYLHGNGEMFAHNKVGQKLQQYYNNKSGGKQKPSENGFLSDSDFKLHVYMYPVNAGRSYAIKDLYSGDIYGSRPFSDSKRFLGFRAAGDSMQDAGIIDGSILIVDLKAEPRNNNIIVVEYNGSLICRTYIEEEGKLFFKPENQKYQSLHVNGNSSHSFVGVVVKIETYV